MECVPRHMNDCNEQVGIVNVIPGESGLSWYLVFMRALLGLWFICEVFMSIWSR